MATIDMRGATLSAADPPIGTNPNPDLAIKAPVRVATTGGNINLQTLGLGTIDGVALAAGDRVLVKDQTDQTTNGIYNASTGPWTRTIDANNNSQLTTGTLVPVINGTQNGGKVYQVTAALPIVLGTTSLAFAVMAIATGNFVGDSGAGGSAGLVPAPPAGSSALNKFLMASGSFIALLASVVGYTLAATGAAPRTVQNKLGDLVSVLDFGADPTGIVDATTAIQNAVNFCQGTGAALLVETGFQVSGTITITKPITIIGTNRGTGNGGNTGSANITATTASNDVFIINSSLVLIQGLYINRAGNPTTGRGIAIGTDYRAITDAAIALSSTTLNSPSQANFVNAQAPAGDIGKAVYFSGAGSGSGPLFATITAVISATQATLNTAALTGVASGGSCQYGLNYSEIVIRDCQLFNHNIGLHNVSSQQIHFDHVYALGKFPFIHENRLWSDQGDSFVSDCTFFSNDAVAGITFQYRSGGGLKVVNTKILAGLYCMQVEWANQSSASFIFGGNSVEGGASGAVYINNSALLGRVQFANNYFASNAGTVFQIDSTATNILTDFTFVGNSIYSLAATIGMDIGQTTWFNIGDNVIDLGGAGTAYAIRSNAAHGKIETGICNVGTLIACASSTVLIDSLQGDTFAHLPASAQNGSRFFVSDGTAASSPVTGSGTGTTAFRQNGAWKGI